MALTSGATGSATVTMAITGQMRGSHSLDNAVANGRHYGRLENVFLKRNQDLRRNLRGEERLAEKRWLPLLLPASQSWEYRSGKARRLVCVSASSLDWAVSTKFDASGASTTPYVVQEGDTLTSIAKKTRTSVQLLADASSIEDVNYLLSGQLLRIPTNPGELPSRPVVGADEFPIARVYDARPSSQQERITKASGVKSISSRGVVSPKSEGSHLAASVQPAVSFNFPKFAVPILLIAPLLGFCIRCIVDALYMHMDRVEAKDQAERDAWEKLHSPKANRWQKILEEDRDGVETSIPSPEDSTPKNVWTGGDVWSQDKHVREDKTVREDTRIPIETTRENIRDETDEEVVLRQKQDYEDIQKSYAELESVYAKFLADSGMSKSGYWRGSGVPTTAGLDDGEP
ncbi:unnamed protein product [Calypogeia fissa]